MLRGATGGAPASAGGCTARVGSSADGRHARGACAAQLRGGCGSCASAMRRAGGAWVQAPRSSAQPPQPSQALRRRGRRRRRRGRSRRSVVLLETKVLQRPPADRRPKSELGCSVVDIFTRSARYGAGKMGGDAPPPARRHLVPHMRLGRGERVRRGLVRALVAQKAARKASVPGAPLLLRCAHARSRFVVSSGPA